MDEESKNGQDNLIDDMGKVQDALAKLLPPNTKYYVDAKKNESLSESFGSAFYSYEDTHRSKLQLHHETTSSEGNCLTYSKSIDSTLQSAGEDCEAKLMPLCFLTGHLFVYHVLHLHIHCDLYKKNSATLQLRDTNNMCLILRHIMIPLGDA